MGLRFRRWQGSEWERQQLTKQGFETKRQAEEALRGVIADREKGLAIKEDPRSFGEFIKEWLDRYGASHWGKKTAQENGKRAAYAVRMFGTVPLQALTAQRIERDLYTLLAHGGMKTDGYPAGRPLSPKTIQEIASLVNQCLVKAVKWKLIASNPMEDVDRPSVKHKEVTVPQIEQFEQYLQAIQNTRYYAFSVFCAAIGCRRGEALALQWKDINWRTGFVNISKSLSEVAGTLEIKSTKSNRARPIRISKATLEVLQEHRAEMEREKKMCGEGYENNDLVFPRPDGRYYMPDQVSGRISEFMRKADIKASLHSLRHLHASLLLSKAVPITVIRDRLGHATSQVTLNIYSHVLKNDDVAALATWDAETEHFVRRTGNNRRSKVSGKANVRFCEAAEDGAAVSH